MTKKIINQEKISIIIPVYNVELYLEKCLNSIINQTYKNIEIICINDGSKDNSLNILKKYQKKDKRITIIDKKNNGLSSARNNGIKVSTGEYITFVDSDDWLEKNAIEILYNTIKKENVDVVRGNYCINYDYNDTNIKNKGNLYKLENQKYYTQDKNFANKIIDKFITGKIPCYSCLFLIKKEITNKISFKEDIKFMEDTIFFQELMNNIDSIYLLDKPLYHYYQNPNSLSRSNKNYTKNMYILIEINKITNKIMINSKFYSKERIELLNTTQLYLILNYFYYIYHFNNKSKPEIINEINKILNNKDMENIIKNSNLKLLPIYIRIFVILPIKKKYKLLFILYNIRKTIIDTITK